MWLCPVGGQQLLEGVWVCPWTQLRLTLDRDDTQSQVCLATEPRPLTSPY